MKKKLFISSFIVLSALALFFSACEKQRPQIEEGEFSIISKDGLPSPGEKIEIFYRPDKSGTGQFEVSVARDFGEYANAHPITKSEGGILSAEYDIPDDAIGVWIYVRGLGTCYSGDLPVEAFMLFDENGVPIRGTRAWFATNIRASDSTEADSLESLFSEDIKDNPDHLMAYASRWRRIMWGNPDEEFGREMNDVLSKSDEYPEGWAALAMGYAYTGKADSSVAMFEKYMESADSKDWAPHVVYHMEMFLMENPPEELHTISNEIAERYPASHLAEFHVLSYIFDDFLFDYPDDRIERIITERVKRLPKAFYELARYRLNNSKDTVAAVAAANRYEEAVMRGDIDTLDGFTVFRRAEMLEIVSRDLMAKGEIKKALGKADLALKVARGSEFAGRFAALCAECAFLDNDTAKAEDYIIEAIAVGSVDKAMEIVERFQLKVNKTEYLRGFFAKAESKCDTAAKIEIATDSGDTVKIGGSGIIVIDFWGPGCKPCIDEIPILSKLAGEYFDRPIRWLAITNYPKSFFEKHPVKFDNWDLCYGQKEPFRAFLKTSAIPQFFIVDKKGLIRYSRIGSFEGNDTDAPAKILDFLLEQENINLNAN